MNRRAQPWVWILAFVLLPSAADARLVRLVIHEMNTGYVESVPVGLGHEYRVAARCERRVNGQEFDRHGGVITHPATRGHRSKSAIVRTRVSWRLLKKRRASS